MQSTEGVPTSQPAYIGDEHLRALGLGLAGPHRCGKTTIAVDLAAKLEIPFIASAGSQVAKDMGLKVDAGMPMPDRLAFQERVLEVFEARYMEQNGLFIADRTPLDFAGYLLLDWNAALSTPEQDAQILSYVDRCIEVTNRYFVHLAVIQPGIPYVTGEGKPAPNPLYQEALNTVIIGLAWDDRIIPSIQLLPRELTDLNERIVEVGMGYGDIIREYRGVLGSHLTLH